MKETYRTCLDCGRHELLTYDPNPDYDSTKRTIIDELETRCWPCHRKRHNNIPDWLSAITPDANAGETLTNSTSFQRTSDLPH